VLAGVNAECNHTRNPSFLVIPWRDGLLLHTVEGLCRLETTWPFLTDRV
jgi:hypothetical protein